MRRLAFVLALCLILSGGSIWSQGQPTPQQQLLTANANATAAETEADKLFTGAQWKSAAAAYEAITKGSPANTRAWFLMGASLHEAGEYVRAAAAHQEASRLGMTPPFLPLIRVVRAYVRAGNNDKAFETLTSMLANGFANAPVVENHPDLAALRADARYAAALTRLRANADPCNASANYRQLDFWVGHWEVQLTGTAKGTPGFAVNVIEKVLNGCALWENWQPSFPAGHGKGLHLFNAATGKWEQHWVTATGAVVNFGGEFKDGKMHYVIEAMQPSGARATRVTKIYPLDKDTVRQHGESSTDGGKTWTPTFDLTYYRKTSN